MALAMVSGWLLPLVVICPAISVLLSNSRIAWPIAKFCSGLGLFIALILWVLVVIFGATLHPPEILNLSPLRATILLLVCFIAQIVLLYAHKNFTNDPDHARFLRWLASTIFAVSLTVISNHLIVFWVAWMLISLSMHQLLVFYPWRYRAVLAAHKKFIVARSAEFLLATAFLLLYSQHHNLLIAEILQELQHQPLLWQHQVAGILLAGVALIKCAQLPLHGWLMQVVESPTPVSALLHAGIINLGGFLLLLFAPLFSLVPVAQWLALIIAGFTASFAALVMMTRISIKVRLAWSTCAQMGLMLVECALGLYELALLHLIAHSCYKAHAFLNAGSAVSDSIQSRLLVNPKNKLNSWLIAALSAASLVALLAAALNSPLPLSPWIVLTMALTVVLAHGLHQKTFFSLVRALFEALVIASLYVLFKLAAQHMLPGITHQYLWQTDLFISSLFIGILVIYVFLECFPRNPLAKKLFIALYAGFYLDEWSTRLTLALWPIQLSKLDKTCTNTTALPHNSPVTQESV